MRKPTNRNNNGETSKAVNFTDANETLKICSESASANLNVGCSPRTSSRARRLREFLRIKSASLFVRRPQPTYQRRSASPSWDAFCESGTRFRAAAPLCSVARSPYNGAYRWNRSEFGASEKASDR